MEEGVLKKIVIQYVTNGWSRQAYIQVVYFESGSFRAAVKLFVWIDTVEEIFTYVILPSKNKLSRLNSNHTGHSVKLNILEVKSWYHPRKGHTGNHKKNNLSFYGDESTGKKHASFMMSQTPRRGVKSRINIDNSVSLIVRINPKLLVIRLIMSTNKSTVLLQIQSMQF